MIAPTENRERRWAILVLLVAVFLLIQYSPSDPALEEDFDLSSLDPLQAIATGTLHRQLAMVTLGFLGIFGVPGWPRNPLEVRSFLGWVILFFLLWVLLSLLWAESRGLAFRRIAAFGMICLGALAFIRHYTIEDLPVFAFAATGTYLLAGLLFEAWTGAFRPSLATYRFSGLMHPNSQAIQGAVFLFASIAISRDPRFARWRPWLRILPALALVLLFLTKSRTTFVSSLASVGLFAALSLTTPRKLALLLSCAWLACLALLFLPADAIVPVLFKPLFLGREYSDIHTLTGRVDIWRQSLAFAWQRPFLGYGFGCFWTENRILDFHEVAGWPATHAHSAYIDLWLGLGLAGVVSYVLIMCEGVRRAIALRRVEGGRDLDFVLLLFVYTLLNGALETVLPYPGTLTFLVFSALGFLAFRPPGERVAA